MSKLKIIQALFLSTLSVVSTGYATTYDRAYLEDLAKSFVDAQLKKSKNERVTIKVSSIDPRVKIKPCNSPLTANIPENSNGRNVNVKINCGDSIPWLIYVPVKVYRSIPVLVAVHSIDKGNILDNNNIGLIYQDRKKIRGTILDNPSVVIGSKAKRKISKGHHINERNICMVCKGDSVSIIATSQDFSIKTSGIALSNGALGSSVQVKNKQSGKIITGQVKAINKVIINL